MTFVQEYKMPERYYANQTVRVVISDTYANLFLSTAAILTAEGVASADVTADCLELEAVKKKLESASGAPVSDELTFKINEALCTDDANKNLLAFCREAVNSKEKRYIAVFIDPVFTGGAAELLKSLDFVGKINNTVKGTDLIWTGAEYSGIINPIREYNFSALSFDATTLSEVPLDGTLERDDGEVIDGVFGYRKWLSDITYAINEEVLYGIETIEGKPVPRAYRAAASSTNEAPDDGTGTNTAYWTKLTFTGQEAKRIKRADVDAVFARRLHGREMQWKDFNLYSYWEPLGNMFDALVLITDAAEQFLKEMYRTSFTLNLSPCSLGFQSCPTSFNSDNLGDYSRHMALKAEVGQRYELRLTDAEDLTQEIWRPIFISRKFFDYKLNDLATVTSTDDAFFSSGRAQSIRGAGTLIDLFDDIAKTFGLLTYYSASSNAVNISFTPRSELTSGTKTIIADAIKAEYELSTEIEDTDEGVFYYCQVTPRSSDGYPRSYSTITKSVIEESLSDYIYYKNSNFELRSENYIVTPFLMEGSDRVFSKNSSEYDNLLEYLAGLRDAGVKTERLLCSLGQTWKSTYSNKLQLPINTLHVDSSTYDFSSYEKGKNDTREILTSNIYLWHEPITDQQRQYLWEYLTVEYHRYVWSAANYVFVNVNGEQKTYRSLASYIQSLRQNIYTQYKAQYRIEVDTWNQFRRKNPGETGYDSTDDDNGRQTWRAATLGSIIELSTNVRQYNSASGAWEDTQLPAAPYVIVEIERDYKEGKTKLVLINNNDATYEEYDGTPISLPGEDTEPPADTSATLGISGDDFSRFFFVDVTAGEAISAGDLVIVDDDGKAYRATAHENHHGKYYGIAGYGVVNGEMTRVQCTGIAYVTGLSLMPGKPLYCRTNDSGINLSQTPLSEPTTTENVFCIIGTAISSSEFLLNTTIDDYIMEE